MRYIRIWLQLAKINFTKIYGYSRLEAIFLVLAKVIRFAFFFVFIFALVGNIKTLVGFDLVQVLLFYMTFNLIDITVQFLLRGIYSVRDYMQNGTVDLALTQPLNFMFRIASDWIDFLDFLTLIPLLFVLGLVMANLPGFSLLNLFVYALLILNAFLIALSIHMVVLGVSLISQETSGEIWIYRDLVTMGRFPSDIFPLGIQFVLTYILPVVVMVSLPAKALIGVLSPQALIIALSVGIFSYVLGTNFLRFALRRYSSISS